MVAGVIVGVFLFSPHAPEAAASLAPGGEAADALTASGFGFAMLPAFWGQGYAHEAVSAVMSHGREVLGLQRIVAIVSPDNERSIRILERIGLRF